MTDVEKLKKNGVTILPPAPKAVDNPVDPALASPEIDDAYVASALDWAVSSSLNLRCSVCGNPFDILDNPQDNEKGLRNHYQTQHFARVCVGYSHKNLDAMYEIARDEAAVHDELFEQVGLEVDAESGDHYNCLEIDPDLQARITADGSRPYWANPRNLIRYKRRGMEVVKHEGKDVHGAHDQLGANELVLMKIPARLAEIRDRIKQRAIDQSVDARREDRMSRLGEIQRSVHDTMAKRGANPDQIRNVVSAVGAGLQTGTLKVKDAKGNREYRV